MCSSPSETFVWVGAVLVNFGFITLIAWSAATLWPLGFVLCGAYTILSFWLARWLQKREEGTVVSEETSEQNEEGFVQEATPNEGSRLVQEDESTDDIIPTGSIPNTQRVQTVSLLVSVLYGLAIVSLGVTGFFIPANVFDHCDPFMPQETWTTNISSLPEGVQNWALGSKKDTTCNSFAYLMDTHTTFFGASISCDYAAIGLWSVNGTDAPKNHNGYKYPEGFIALSNKTVCFESTVPSSNFQRVIHCADKAGIYPSTPPPEGFVNPRTFFAFNNTLWFKAGPQRPSETGDIIYSLDPDSMNIKLYSHKEHSSNSNGKGCDFYKVLPKQAITTFFVTALPVTCASIMIWKIYQIPSMATTTYAGLTAMFISLYLTTNPRVESERPFAWWFTITGLFWLLIMSYFHLLSSTSQAKQAPLRWGLLIGGLAFCNVSTLLPMEKDRLIDWILLNLLLFVPLIVLGAANKNGFLQFLGAIGLLVDAGRFADFVATHVRGQAQVPVEFLVFSLMGMMVAFFGLKVNQYQDHIKQWAVAVVQQMNQVLSNLVSRDVPGPSIESEHDSTEPLLENQAAQTEDDTETENV